MLRSSFKRNGVSCCGLIGVLLANAACLLPAGCAAFRGPDYDFSAVDRQLRRPPAAWSEEVRGPDRSTEPFAVTNQGMQIEQDFGVY